MLYSIISYYSSLTFRGGVCLHTENRNTYVQMIGMHLTQVNTHCPPCFPPHQDMSYCSSKQNIHVAVCPNVTKIVSMCVNLWTGSSHDQISCHFFIYPYDYYYVHSNLKACVSVVTKIVSMIMIIDEQVVPTTKYHVSLLKPVFLLSLSLCQCVLIYEQVVPMTKFMSLPHLSIWFFFCEYCVHLACVLSPTLCQCRNRWYQMVPMIKYDNISSSFHVITIVTCLNNMCNK